MNRYISLILFIGLVWGQTTIAVFDLENNGLKDSDVRILTDRLQSELVKVGSYTVVERKKIEKVFEEQKFQMSGCVEECLIEIGMLLGAKEIVIGSVGKFGSTYTISARLVNATTGEMIRSSDFDSEGDISVLLKSGMFRVASELTGRVIPPQLTDKIVNNNIKGLGKGTFVSPVFLLREFYQVTNGFGLDIGSNGSGMFIIRNYVHASERLALNGELRFYDIKAEDETIVYDYYTGQYKSVGGKSLVMLPVFVGGNYYPFVGKIENNFSPFIAIKGGVVTTVDGEESGTFSERWKNPGIQYSPGGFLGLGIDFKIVGQSFVMVMVGREYLPLRKKTDGKKDYSGFLIHLSFNRRAK